MPSGNTSKGPFAMSPGWQNRSTEHLQRMLTKSYYEPIHHEIKAELDSRK